MNNQKKNYYISSEQLNELNWLQKKIDHTNDCVNYIFKKLNKYNDFSNNNFLFEDLINILEEIKNIEKRLVNNKWEIGDLIENIQEQKI
jgi:hypothetical protein